MATVIEECFQGSIVDEIVAVTMNSIAIIVMLTIGITAYKRLRSGAKMHRHLEILCYTAIAAGCVIQIGSILSIALCPSHGENVQIVIMLFVVYYGFVVLFSCIIGTVVIRLFVTFEHSSLRITKTRLIISISLTVIMCFIWITSAILDWVGWVSDEGFYIMTCVGLVIFVVVAVRSVYRFIRNLLALAGMTDDENFDKKPQRLINLSMKYLTLFLFAVTSSILVVVVTAVCRMIFNIHPGIIWSVDCVTNILCLFLQVLIQR